MPLSDDWPRLSGPESISLEKEELNHLWELVRALKQEQEFTALFSDPEQIQALSRTADTLSEIITRFQDGFTRTKPTLPPRTVEKLSVCLETLKDIHWCLKQEVLGNVTTIADLMPPNLFKTSPLESLSIFQRINAVLNSIDRLEVRGRDSAGISVLFTLSSSEFNRFKNYLNESGLSGLLKQRTNHSVLANNCINVNNPVFGTQDQVSISFVYKYAAEIGALGDNIAFIRTQIRNDLILMALTGFHLDTQSVSAHTRWASVGDITDANCHPVDNTPADKEIETTGTIHVCLNGDIDNYLELKTEYEALYDKIHPRINTDTKLIPLQIQHYLKQGAVIEEAFRSAVNDFDGSHAISMHTDLAPGKLFLAQKGSGQAIFVGIGPDHYIAASELYGVVEQTSEYIKLNGEESGQIVILDQKIPGAPGHSLFFLFR